MTLINIKNNMKDLKRNSETPLTYLSCIGLPVGSFQVCIIHHSIDI